MVVPVPEVQPSRQLRLLAREIQAVPLPSVLEPDVLEPSGAELPARAVRAGAKGNPTWQISEDDDAARGKPVPTALRQRMD